MNSNNDNGNVTERTSLLAAENSTATEYNNNGVTVQNDDAVRTEAGQQQQPAVSAEQQALLWEEMEKPWPSTYERAISLLSSPVLQFQEVDMITKSPKPGSSIAALARRRNFERGFYTPETGPGRISNRKNDAYNYGENYDDEEGNDRSDELSGSWRVNSINTKSNHSKDSSNLNAAIAKMKSIEYLKKNAASIDQVTKTQQQKAQQAKEYREKILQKTAGAAAKTGGDKKTTTTKKSTPNKSEGGGDGHHHGSSSIIRETSFAQCVFNLANILMGMGLLGLPYAFNAAGWIGGGISLLIFGFITWRTSVLIGRELNGDPRPASYFNDSPFKTPLLPGSIDPRARMLPPVSSFPDIARRSFGETGAVVLSILLYFELFSCICIFLVSIGDHLHELLPAYSVSQHITFAMVLSLIPTVLLHTPKLLSYFSMIGTGATVTVVLVVIAAALLEGDISERVAEKNASSTATAAEDDQVLDTQNDANDDDDVQYHILWRPQGLILALGIISYCFSGHAIVPSIYSSMKHPQEFERMVTFTFCVVVAACFAVAISGYYMFGITVADQVTLSLKQNSKAAFIMNTLTCLMVLTALSKITLTMFPLALGMLEVIAPYLTSEKMVDLCSVTIKITLTIGAAVMAIYGPSFSFLCALTGLICTMSVSVIFPAAAHYKLFYPNLTMFDKISDILMVVAGIIMAIVGTVVTIQEI